jgi:hypothetical protein
MSLSLIRGRKPGMKKLDSDARHTALAMLGQKPDFPLLVDARQLTQDKTSTTRPVNLSRLLRQVYRRCLPIAQRRHIDFSLDLQMQQIVIKGQPTILEWVLSTLVDYALYDTPAFGDVVLSADIDSSDTCSVGISTTIPEWCFQVVPSAYASDCAPYVATPWAEKYRDFSTAMRAIALQGGSIEIEADETLGIDVSMTFVLITKMSPPAA